MSEQVENPPPAEIVPAKSEDKLEIEKEEEDNKVEKESDNKEQEEAKVDEPVEEEKSEMDEKQAEKSDESKEEADKKDSEQKDENEPEEKAADEAIDKKDTDEAAAGSDSKKKFKIPDVKLKTPKVPGFLRSKSKDRKKDEGEEAKEGEEKKEEGDEATAEDAEAGEGTSKDAKAKVKEAMDKLPKMPKIHKPAFLKKGKKEGEQEEDQAEEGGEDKKEGDEAEGEAAADEETKKKTLVDSLKGLKGQLLSKKGKADKDPEAGGVDVEEESKELLDKDKAEEEGCDKKEGEEGKTEEAGGKGFMDYLRSAVPPFFKKSEPTPAADEGGEKELEEVKVEQPDNKDEDATDGVASGEKKKLVEGNKDDDTASHKSEKKDAEKEEGAAAAPSAGGRGAAILESLRNVASQVPSMFKNKQKEKTKSGGGGDHDVEAGEKDELLEKGEGEEAAKAADSKAAEGDEAPAEGSGGDEAKPWDKHLCRAKQCGTQALDRFNGLDKTTRLAAAGLCGALLFILLIIVIVCAALPSGYSNDFRIVDCPAGKCVETESFCGRIQGLVEGPDEFAFTRIPYTAEPPTGTNRWRHSTTFTDLSHCHEGTLVAHSHNDSAGSCWRRYPTGADGDENCTNLDVYTSSVVYDKLMPVVVYIDGGDDLDAETEKLVQPSASLAKNQSVVFVKVNYRRGVFGFLSLDSLSGREYPKHSGNYGLGDIISALKWIKRNIQHFGGHPKMVTLLGRGEGATLVTTLTATAEAKGLFKQVWATNGAGVLSEKELDDANRENKVLFEKLNCENEEEEADCLVDLPTPEDLVKAVPYEWSSARQRKLPKQGESQLGHSWVIIDKHILKESPYTYWKDNKLSNNVPIVFGSTAQGAVTVDNWNFKTDWNDQDSYEAQVEESLGSFNVSIPKSAMEKYSQDDNWLAYASMLTDIRRVCPLQDLARTVAENFQAQVYSYVATQPRAKLHGVADSTSDIEAILGVYRSDGGDDAYVANIQKMFYEFVSTGRMHQNKDVLAGVYTVGAEIATHAHYPNCEFWKSAQAIVPAFADYN